MSYNILAVNPGHNGSICLLKDGEIDLYIEEERITRIKYDSNPIRTLYKILETTKIDALVLGGTHGEAYPKMTWDGQDVYSSAALKYNSKCKIIHAYNDHHIGHAAGAFYNSGFTSAAVVIVDGAGTMLELQVQTRFPVKGFETETIFHANYPDNLNMIYKSIGANYGSKLISEDGKVKFDGNVNITKAYESVTTYAGFHPIEAGKLMGLSSYGKKNPKIPQLFIGEDANKNVFTPTYPSGGFINIFNCPDLKLKSIINPLAYSGDIEEIAKVPEDLELVQDMAWEIQQCTQRLVGDLIQKAIDLTGEKNVCISGGFGLNCVANYYYKKRFPNINLFVDPVSHDGGTTIGLAKLAWYTHCKEEGKDFKKSPLKTLFLGSDRNKEIDEQKYTESFEIKKATANDVAKLIDEQNIICLFNGSSEAGPRALGNRSILFDPRVPNGKDIVNTVKGREWFRPFAGSMLKEYANEWFDMAGLDESPFMMYAVDVLPGKKDKIPCITHVDGTCRIQTVTKEQNSYYYDLIEAFYQLTGVPILFNTSFNLAGDPLVETFEDALETLSKSKLKYLYVPSKEFLFVKKG